uniref:Uncharacterized protein n=1 Tax=Rhizophora mucronata TaxID=61149 RepID=A0A2P2J0D0_RHIMU
MYVKYNSFKKPKSLRRTEKKAKRGESKFEHRCNYFSGR